MRVTLGVVDGVTGVGPLGLVHGHVRSLEEGVTIDPVPGEDGDADAGVDVKRHVAQVEGLREGGTEALCHGAGEGGVALFQEHGELVASQAGEDVVRAQLLDQPGADLVQQEVTHVVAERVVHLLEAVEIDEQQRQRLFVARSASVVFRRWWKRQRLARPVSSTVTAWRWVSASARSSRKVRAVRAMAATRVPAASTTARLFVPSNCP